MDDEAKTEARGATEIRMIYEQLVNEIGGLKQRQWTLTYYSGFVYVALVGVATLARPDNLGPWLSQSLGAFAVIVGLASVGLILDLQGSLKDRRERCVRIQQDHFSQETKKLLEFRNDNDTSFWYQWPICVLKIVVTIAGAGLVNWIVWWRAPIGITLI